MSCWVEVKCACTNRGPVIDDWLNKSHPCGHRDGTLYQLWPGNLIKLANALANATENHPEIWETFESLDRILDWRQGSAGGCLTLSIEDAKELRLELEEVSRFHEGVIGVPYSASRKWNEFWRREDAGSVKEIIAEALKLCDVSIESGNPIEFRR